MYYIKNPDKDLIFLSYIKDVSIGIFSAALMAVFISYYDYAKQVFRNLSHFMIRVNNLYKVGNKSCIAKSIIAVRLEVDLCNDELYNIFSASKKTKANGKLIDLLGRIKISVEQINVITNSISSSEDACKKNKETILKNQNKLIISMMDYMQKGAPKLPTKDGNYFNSQINNIDILERNIELFQEEITNYYSNLNNELNNLRVLNEMLFIEISKLQKRFIFSM